MNNRNIAIIAIVIIAVAAIGVYGYNTYSTSSESGTIVIYAADSLASQLNETIKEFKTQQPNVNVEVHYSGSQSAIRQITDLNKTADIVASADYGLIDQRLIPNYTSWNAKYARNEMVIAYTNKSKNSSQLNSTNWYQILNQSDVKFGFSDPNSDPAGYRAVMMIQLANSYYNDSSIFDSLISQNSAITVKENDTGYVINAPGNLNPGSHIMIKDDDAQLMPSLESGALDYAIVYKNLAEQHKDSGVEYMVLPGKLSLNDTQYESDYKKISLVEYSDSNDANKTKVIKLSPIVYGITVLNNAPQKQLATEFVQLLLSPTGTQIIQNSFQDPITPAIATNDSTNIPEALQQYITNST
ncbi:MULTISPECIES: tungstate ABC transporter substrate-binding protein WtpA [Methanobacterium]|jgi:molybdate/tungstate transport system substrate-binding protein|uniref:Tungstate ABC transporter substrate-binding protein WtpA n=1 Tax=Methanobacterium veterum TaxID=408577 RepID=A0A9E4ZXC6_9EURY|nr:MULTISPECIES: tungstate ABC transporter substrate-binding protein WtpA [Methanobacterium]MCZ3365348.1 tungstate ABC transporter substrate-binding protein WtpA [Methanobacterium veterum]MCZ3373099.1 tungstate ABC transporter substrate-binding protein WtpA [Methanobacterium veterum]